MKLGKGYMLVEVRLKIYGTVRLKCVQHCKLAEAR